MALIQSRYAEMERLDKLDQLSAEIEFMFRKNDGLVKVTSQELRDDKVIDELLEDASDIENELKM